MIYLLPLLTASMLAYMFWRSTFRLRADRVKVSRQADRSSVILAPKHRARLNFTRAFQAPKEQPEWEAALVASLQQPDGSRIN